MIHRSLLTLTRALALAGVTLFIVSCSDEAPTGPGGAVVWRSPGGLALTAPPEILIGAGDIASCSVTGDERTAEIIDTIPGTVMAIGDLSYPNATTSEWTNCYNPSWGRFKSRTRPAAGNHEYNTTNADPYWAYFGDLAGPARKGWFSYDLGAWHVIVLNSNISYKVGSEQELWLKADLAAHPNQCALAYFHHPLYSSTTGTGTGGVTHAGVRPFWDDMYPAGVDIVLGGHRHFYERLSPMRPDGTRDDAYGIREFIVGSGGIGGGTVTNLFPLSEVRNGDTRGVMKLYLYPDSYAWKFIPQQGKTFTDSGSAVCHGPPGSPTTPTISASLSSVSATPASITAGSGSSTVSVTVKDQNGNPMSGVSVTLAATGTGNTITQPATTTNASGVATGALSSTSAGAKTVSATAGAVGITQTAAVTVTAGTVSASTTTVSASPTSIVAGTGTSTITVTAKDAYGNPISGATVVLGATGTGNAITQPSVTTNSSGVATGAFSSTVAESKTVSATVDGTAVTQTATVTVTAAPISASLSAVTAVPTSIEAGTASSAITVTVKDQAGNPVSDVSVTLSATGTGNTLTQPPSKTDASGMATGAIASTAAGTKLVSANAGGTAITQTVSVTVAAGAISADQSTVSATPSTIAAGTGNSTITVTAKDAYGNPISGATVVLDATGTGNTITQPSVTTNTSGVATGALSSTVAEAKTVSATVNGTAATQTATVTVTTAPISAALSTIAATPASLTAGGGSSTITVTVKDANGNPVSGATVVLSATGGGNTLTQPLGMTDAGGVAIGSLSSIGAGTKVISATASGTAITQTASVTVTAGTISAAQSTVGAAPTTIAAGSGSSTITVTVKDDYGNPIAGTAVSVSASGTGNTFTPASGTSTVSGIFTSSLSSTDPQTETVSAVAGGIPISQVATLTVTNQAPASISQRLLTSGNNQTNTNLYTTASITPTPNALILVAVMTHQATSAAPNPVLTGGGMTSWDVVGTVAFDSIATPHQRITLYRAMSPSPGSGAITIKIATTVSHCEWIVMEWTGVETTGLNGAGAIAQTATAATDGGTGLTVALAPFANVNNAAFGMFGVRSPTAVIAPGTGFVEINEQPSIEGSSSASDLQTEWALNDNTVDATWTTRQAGGVAIELKVKTGP